MKRFRRSELALVLCVALLGSTLAAVSGTQAVTPPISTLVAIRAAAHGEGSPAYDRVVFEFSGPVPLINVGYVAQLVHDGSGLPVPITGRAVVAVRMEGAQAHNNAGTPTAPTRVALRLPNIKEVASGGDFEGIVTYGIGVDHKAELRVITLTQPSRVVVDVMQR